MKNRIQGIDLLKCIAIVTIPAQHFFTLQTSFRQSTFDSFPMFLQGVGMEFFLIGIPLFIAITGYLSNQTEPTCKYFRKSLRVIIPYIIISIIYLFFRHYYFGESITIRNGVDMILGFNAISYAWYIEMWIGLYLLAPFLNLLYNNIKSAKTSIILIVTLYVMTYLTISVNREGFHILPNYWTSISPLTCYFIGCHIRKFGVNIPTGTQASSPATNRLIRKFGVCIQKRDLVLFIIFAIIAEPIINLIFFSGQHYRFVLGIYILIVPAMAALFALLYNWQTEHLWLQKVLSIISDHTLEMYLYCAMCDLVLYPFFMRWFVTQSQFGLFFFVIIPIELVTTLCMAWLTNKFMTITRINRIWK